MQSKVQIYNLALSALLLARHITDIDTDTSNEVKVLNQFWETALTSTLRELNLDSLSETIKLELVETVQAGPWKYVYKYPSRCAYMRRISNCFEMDNRSTQIPKAVKLYNGHRCIFTNEFDASIDCIPNDVKISELPPYAFLAIAQNLAFLSSPLQTGKGAAKLKGELFQAYTLYIQLAKEQDLNENFNYDDEMVTSEFVEARMS